MAWYVDSSAVLKLLVSEAETAAMRRWWARSEAWSSELLVTELHRAAGRLGVAPSDVQRLLEDVSIVMPSASTFLTAGHLEPAALRSLDALHLAAALELEQDLEGVVTYDRRQAAAAVTNGVVVVSPGRASGWWN